ncbi:MAG: DUF853 family protein [Porticoccaceae bacterium]|nr:DUF853 family protein [Porticoccaceae bacterium]
MDKLFIGANAAVTPVELLPKMANRHGLIAGATGTGKTVTLQILAESFSNIGVPVFMADVKGDLSGLATAGNTGGKLAERAEKIGFSDYQSDSFPVCFWDLYGKRGHPLRTTVSDMGPLLFSQLLEVNDTQQGVLYAAFKIADDQGLLLLDLKDLRSLLTWMSANKSELSAEYGNISPASVGAIQRRLLVLTEEGGEQFFGEPALELGDLMRKEGARGVINILDATALMPRPRLYSTFLLWLLAELFEQLPEVGDMDAPKLVFFFDEAHLLFDNSPKVLVEKIEQVVRLIRSKGVGIYFVTQSPTDIPEDILGQLGNRVQHALRAFTPKDKRAVKTAAETFRENPNFKTFDVITQLGLGEALVSTLDRKGIPTPVERTMIRPPSSQMGPLAEDARAAIVSTSTMGRIYKNLIDRESAYELLKQRAEKATEQAEATAKALEEQEAREEREESEERSTTRKKKSSGRRSDSMATSIFKSVARSMGTQLGRQLIRGVLGSLTGKG